MCVTCVIFLLLCSLAHTSVIRVAGRWGENVYLIWKRRKKYLFTYSIFRGFLAPPPSPLFTQPPASTHSPFPLCSIKNLEEEGEGRCCKTNGRRLLGAKMTRFFFPFSRFLFSVSFQFAFWFPYDLIFWPVLFLCYLNFVFLAVVFCAKMKFICVQWDFFVDFFSA